MLPCNHLAVHDPNSLHAYPNLPLAIYIQFSRLMSYRDIARGREQTPEKSEYQDEGEESSPLVGITSDNIYQHSAPAGGPCNRW